ncbi:MAG: Gldg family protein [Pseudomonadales bacterium]|jgi:ABC-2 type transport system permease protein|nr:Gldg family protein [Pseudomonadales bacterium]
MPDVLRIARKEFRGFFATPAAYLFIGAFLAVTLFVFFWVETFFARNIADVRPLFDWLPLLLIFLVGALTMRAWSEERRAGTLESLLTAPVKPLSLVLGKFLAALALVGLALLLTLPLPVTVAALGPLDWGPVFGGYVATLFLAAAYIAIGLYMSGRTDNPIVALILTTVVCGAFYLIGTETLTNLFGNRVGGILALLGTGTRFESITRGVLDLRDLYYYLSIVGVFLTLNLFGLERLRWAGNPTSARHRLWGWAAGLAVANFIAANLWLAPIAWARIDLTEGRQFSLSEATAQQLGAVREPLLIRGYFSARTHPLLAPLVPRLRDLLREYAVLGGDRVRVEFIDPQRDAALEEEAASRYGIRPVPFQTADRYQSSVVSSYFDLVIAYGDQFETLNFQDLIEIKASGESDLEVLLKNPEYAITSAVRKVVNAYRAGGSAFETLEGPVTFHGYFSPDRVLPEALRTLRSNLMRILNDLQQESNGRLQVEFADPESDGAGLAEELESRFGFGPMIASLLDPQPFWFYMVLEAGDDAVQVPLPDAFDGAALERAIDSALQRLAPGFLRTLALVKPPEFGPGGHRYEQLTELLAENVRIEETDLAAGTVPDAADLLLVLAPNDLDEKQLFAIDQFLMRGGSVVLSTSPFDVQIDRSLTATAQTSGLEAWLDHLGLEVEDTMVLDPRNAALPVPVERTIGGLPFREIRMLPYPHFPDLRDDSLNPDSPITASLNQLTLNWASPIDIDAEKNAARTVTRLLTSSEEAWLSDDVDIVPDYQTYPDTGFAMAGDRGRRLLAVAVEGRFDSYFAGRESPLAASRETSTAADPDGAATGTDAGDPASVPTIDSVIERSPEGARLVLLASNTFATDTALDLASQGLGTFYTQPVAFLQNAIDDALEDQSLLALRGRTQLARTLLPMVDGEQSRWETLNYVLAVLGLGAVWLWRRAVAGRDRRRYQRILEGV